jgi:hypothetical protein
LKFIDALAFIYVKDVFHDLHLNSKGCCFWEFSNMIKFKSFFFHIFLVNIIQHSTFLKEKN